MAKLIATRFMNTALISYFTTPPGETLSYTRLMAVQSLMISDAFITPALAIVDAVPRFYRRVLSRASTTQRLMNSYFLGSAWDLGERYTSMLKTVLVALFYAAIYPAGCFFASFCFLATFFIDRYKLVREWRSAPAYDAQLAWRAHNVIIGCILLHLLVTSSWYAGWPFDDAILNADGTYTYSDNSNLVTAALDRLRSSAIGYRSAEHRALLVTYGWSTAAVASVSALIFASSRAARAFRRLVRGDYEPVGADQRIAFTDVPRIETYVPMGYPGDDLVGSLVACHAVNLRPEHYPHLVHLDDESDEQAFKRLNVALEFPVDRRALLFGMVQGFLQRAPAPAAV
eukprot:TRINITY_DN10404_c0_g1_i1.p1 TRINITY_DN10404_c0_g1~~TRINITY_DN10404_c0_g1_i1.p1  ORF type:complete len:382 (-),score=131.10 TRINITY_DN10404_c0_g1_i1:194-1222(-)